MRVIPFVKEKEWNEKEGRLTKKERRKGGKGIKREKRRERERKRKERKKELAKQTKTKTA